MPFLLYFTPVMRGKGEVAVNPQEVLAGIDGKPIVAANGGPLVRSGDLDSGLILGSYLKSRTMRTGFHHARREDQPVRTLPFTFTLGRRTWSTGIGPSYYEPNHVNGKDERSVAQRQQVLLEKVMQDREFVSKWDTVEQELSDMGRSRRARAERVILQNLANDAAAVDYAFQLANANGAGFDQDPRLRKFTHSAVSVVAEHYKHMLNPRSQIDQEVLADFFPRAELALELAGDYLATHAPHVDYIRTRRETDTVHTLSAARTFKEEFPHNPTVVVPLFGAYDIYPALKAQGYAGKVVFVLGNEKHSQKEGDPRVHESVMRRFTDDSVAKDLLLSDSIVIFEDSIGTGKTMLGPSAEPELGYIPQIQEVVGGNVPIEAFRTVFHGGKWYPDYDVALGKIAERIGGTAHAYYAQDLRGTAENRAQSELATRNKYTHFKWVTRKDRSGMRSAA